MCLILNVSGSRRLSYDRMEGPVGGSPSGTRTGRRRRAREGLGSRRCAAAARSRELRRGRIVAPPAPENPGWQREGRKQGGSSASPAGRRAPSTKTQKTEGGEDENAFLGLAGEGVTVDLGVCVCVCGGVRAPVEGPGAHCPVGRWPGEGRRRGREASRGRRSPPFARSVFKTGLVVTVAAASSRVMASRGPSTPRIGRAPLRPLLPASRPPPDRPVLPPKPYKGFTFSPAFSHVGDG